MVPPNPQDKEGNNCIDKPTYDTEAKRLWLSLDDEAARELAMQTGGKRGLATNRLHPPRHTSIASSLDDFTPLPVATAGGGWFWGGTNVIHTDFIKAAAHLSEQKEGVAPTQPLREYAP